MRQGSNPKRGRGRNNGRKPSPVRSSVHDSTGPNIRVRGNAYQVMEKYLAMARDAAAAGDRIAAENYYQHAEHYFRTLNASGGNGMGDRHHHMNTPSDPTGGDDSDFDDEMTNARPAAVDQRQMAPNSGAMRPAEQPRIDPSRVEQPRTDMPGTDVAPGAPQPFDARGHGERDHDQRRRGPNGRRRPGMPDGQGPRPGQGGNQPGGPVAPTRDPRSISPGSPAEAASSESEPIDPDKPTDA
jgi:hypothetical protein